MVSTDGLKSLVKKGESKKGGASKLEIPFFCNVFMGIFGGSPAV
jgi:hypothetical protein